MLIAAHSRVRVVLAAHRVDISLPRHRLASFGGVPHLPPRLAPISRRRIDGEHTAFLVEQSILGHVLGRVCRQLVPIAATHFRVLATCRRARRGVPRALDRVGNVIRRAGSVGCIIVMVGTSRMTKGRQKDSPFSWNQFTCIFLVLTRGSTL